jgi:hypothetical protein
MSKDGRSQGGDVQGTTRTDNSDGVGEALSVASASFDPGYDFGKSLDGEGQTKADLMKGYSSYGKSTGAK